MKTLLILLALALMPLAHPIKMTTGKLQVNEKDLVVTINFFIDDFGSHLEYVYNLDPIEDIGILDSSLHEPITDYIFQNFSVNVNTSEPLTLKVTDRKVIDDNVLQVVLQSGTMETSQIKSLRISNALLLDAFPVEQTNILHVFISPKSKPKILRFSSQEAVQNVSK